MSQLVCEGSCREAGRGGAQVVFHGGEAADALYVVERGVVASGGALHGPGAILGLDLAMLSYRRASSPRYTHHPHHTWNHPARHPAL